MVFPWWEEAPVPGDCLGRLQGGSTNQFAASARELTSHLYTGNSSEVEELSCILRDEVLTLCGCTVLLWVRSLVSHCGDVDSTEESLPRFFCLCWQALFAGALIAGS